MAVSSTNSILLIGPPPDDFLLSKYSSSISADKLFPVGDTTTLLRDCSSPCFAGNESAHEKYCECMQFVFHIGDFSPIAAKFIRGPFKFILLSFDVVCLHYM